VSDPENQDPDILGAARRQVVHYLDHFKMRYSEVPAAPAWQVAPEVYLWRVYGFQSDVQPAWFAISGNLPTDYVTSDSAPDLRAAVRYFARLWLEAADCMKAGKSHRSFSIGTPDQWPQLQLLLRDRAQLLAGFSEDEALWVERRA
jgi:hypothetical protein